MNTNVHPGPHASWVPVIFQTIVGGHSFSPANPLSFWVISRLRAKWLAESWWFIFPGNISIHRPVASDTGKQPFVSGIRDLAVCFLGTMPVLRWCFTLAPPASAFTSPGWKDLTSLGSSITPSFQHNISEPFRSSKERCGFSLQENTYLHNQRRLTGLLTPTHEPLGSPGSPGYEQLLYGVKSETYTQ